MSKPFLEQLQDHLVTAGVVGGSTGWDCYLGLEPPDPDQVVVLYETPGQQPFIKAQGKVEPQYDVLGFQVRVRGAAYDYSNARTKIQDVFEAFHQNEPIAGSGDKSFVWLYAVQSAPMPMGLDENNRPEMTWNFSCMRER